MKNLMFAEKINDTEETGLCYIENNTPKLYCLCTKEIADEILNLHKSSSVLLPFPLRETCINAFVEIQQYQMNNVQLARTTDLYKIAGKGLIALGREREEV